MAKFGPILSASIGEAKGKEMTAERVRPSFAGGLCPELWLLQVIGLIDVADGNDNRADWTKFCRARNN